MELKYQYKVLLAQRPFNITTKKFDITYCDATKIVPEPINYEQLKFIKGPYSAFKPPPPRIITRTPADDQAIKESEEKNRDKSTPFAKERGFNQLLQGFDEVISQSQQLGLTKRPVSQNNFLQNKSQSVDKQLITNSPYRTQLQNSVNRAFSPINSPSKVIKGRAKWSRDVIHFDSDWAGGKDKEQRV